MLNLYRHSYNTQIKWIRKHPVQFVILNVTLTALFIGFVEIQDRKIDAEIEEARFQQTL